MAREIFQWEILRDWQNPLNLWGECAGRNRSLENMNLWFVTQQVEDSWKTLEFMVLPFKDYNDVFILGGTDDIQVNLDESNINIQTIASSRHVGPIKARVDEWVKQLDIFGKTLVGSVCLLTYK